MYFVVTALLIVTVGGFGVNRSDWDITKAIHDIYPPPSSLTDEIYAPKISPKPDEIKPTENNYRDVIIFPKDDAASSHELSQDESMKSNQMKDVPRNDTDLDKSISDFFKQLSNSTTMLSSMPENNNHSNSNINSTSNNTSIHLDPKDLESIFKSTPDVQELVANLTNGMNGTQFDTDIRFLSEPFLRGAFHNNIEDKGVKLRTMLIPMDQNPIPVETGRSVIVKLEHGTSMNGSKSLVVSSFLLFIVFLNIIHV